MTKVLDGVKRRVGPAQPIMLATPGSATTAAAMTAPVALPLSGPILDGIIRRPLNSGPETSDAVIASPTSLPQTTVEAKSNLLTVLTYAAVAPMLLVGAALAGQQLLKAPAVIQTPTALSQAAAEPQPPAEAPVPPVNVELQSLLDQFSASHAASFGILVKDLKSGTTAGVNIDKVFTSASFYKLFVANQLYQLAAQGQLNLDAGLQRCLRVMINISDNNCGALLGDKLGWGRQDAAIKAQGYLGTSLTSLQKTTPADVALLFERIYSKANMDPAHADQFMSFLKEQKVNNRLPVGLSAGTQVAHKTGDLFGYVHDGGIVFGPKTDYLVIVMSGPWSKPQQAPATFADLSAKVFNLLNK